MTNAHEEASDRVFSALSSHFKRPETFWNAQTYTQGLMSHLESKNAWTISEWAGHSSPDRLQYLLERARWDESAVRTTLGPMAVEALGTAGILAFDETGHVKNRRSLTSNCWILARYYRDDYLRTPSSDLACEGRPARASFVAAFKTWRVWCAHDANSCLCRGVLSASQGCQSGYD
ncbi:transposase [Haloglycomyces albus]|uniref:transposase n=1 Tax=Haloglycomyces albus TaxID=526067 RepID=UPI0012EBAEB2|nr:transposase [Haloglycomyces albus]